MGHHLNSHNVAGKLSALVEGGSAVVTFGYEGRDRRSVLNRANGAQTLYGYDGGGRLSGYAFRLAGGAGEGFTLQRNAAGQVTSRAGDTGAWEGPGPAQAAGGFQADALNRIATVDGVALAYDGQSNTARDASGRSFGYDAAGELTVANGVALAYDGLGRLVGEGGRRFVYDGNDLVAEYGADGSLSARYVHGPGEDEPLVAHDGSGAAHHLLADASGSLVGVTGPGGGLEARTAYDDFAAASTQATTRNPRRISSSQSRGIQLLLSYGRPTAGLGKPTSDARLVHAGRRGPARSALLRDGARESCEPCSRTPGLGGRRSPRASTAPAMQAVRIPGRRCRPRSGHPSW